MLEAHLRALLLRLGQADRIARNHGEPEPFALIYSSAGPVALRHPAWDRSWANPTAEDIDDLAELEYVRLQPVRNFKRLFSLSVKGRQEASALVDAPPLVVGNGRAPSINAVLDWLLEVEIARPEAFELPTRLLDHAEETAFVTADARESLADAILALHSQGYLSGQILDIEQATSAQRLGLADEGLRLTMKAHERRTTDPAPSTSINVGGDVIGSQIAAGDLSNYVTIGDLLDRANEELAGLTDVDEDVRDEARALLDVMRGKATEVSTGVVSGAGGALLAGVFGQLLGLQI